jgi:peptidoglycan hydrolase CwlO-like protein
MKMKDIQERLFELQKLIESARARKHEAQGAIANIKSQLKSQFNINSVEEAKAFLEKTNQEIGKLSKQIETRIAKLEDMVTGKQ